MLEKSKEFLAAVNNNGVVFIWQRRQNILLSNVTKAKFDVHCFASTAPQSLNSCHICLEQWFSTWVSNHFWRGHKKIFYAHSCIAFCFIRVSGGVIGL